METLNYPQPVDKLLTYGDGQEVGTSMDKWPEYLELGLGPEHIPDLIRLATDEELRWAYSDTLEVWVPIHAWRTLAVLRAEAAIEPLLSLLEDSEDDDWVMEELPEVYGMIGPAAIPALTAYLDDDSHLDWARIIAASCLEKIGTMHPESRDRCVAVLVRQLESAKKNDPEFNSFIISHLVDLKAVEAAPIIEQAFDTSNVDLLVEGGWEDVQVQLGLKSREEVLQQRLQYLLGADVQSTADEEIASSDTSSFVHSEVSHKRHVVRNKAKAKNKMAKQSRKKNRRKK